MTITKDERCYNIIKRAVENGCDISDYYNDFQNVVIKINEECGESHEINEGYDLVALMGEVLQNGWTFEEMEFDHDIVDALTNWCESYLFEKFSIEDICTDAEFNVSGYNQNLLYCDEYGYEQHVSGDIIQLPRFVSDQNRVKWVDGKMEEADNMKDMHFDYKTNEYVWNEDCYFWVDTFVDSMAKVRAILAK